jgi:hypothetical protein
VKGSGYPFAFVIVAVASLAALPLLIGMRATEPRRTSAA